LVMSFSQLSLLLKCWWNFLDSVSKSTFQIISTCLIVSLCVSVFLNFVSNPKILVYLCWEPLDLQEFSKLLNRGNSSECCFRPCLNHFPLLVTLVYLLFYSCSLQHCLQNNSLMGYFVMKTVNQQDIVSNLLLNLLLLSSLYWQVKIGTKSWYKSLTNNNKFHCRQFSLFLWWFWVTTCFWICSWPFCLSLFLKMINLMRMVIMDTVEMMMTRTKVWSQMTRRTQINPRGKMEWKEMILMAHKWILLILILKKNLSKLRFNYNSYPIWIWIKLHKIRGNKRT